MWYFQGYIWYTTATSALFQNSSVKIFALCWPQFKYLENYLEKWSQIKLPPPQSKWQQYSQSPYFGMVYVNFAFIFQLFLH